MASASSFDDAFVKVWFDEGAKESGDNFYDEWHKLASAQHQEPSHYALHTLKKLYPNSTVTMSADSRVNLLNYPKAVKVPVKAAPLITNMFFVALSRSAPVPGLVVDSVELGTFHVSWGTHDFLLYLVKVPQGAFGSYSIYQYLIHDGPEINIRNLLVEVGVWSNALHGEIWVFTGSYWEKSAALWNEAQKANWADVILKDKFKTAFRKDIYGFFESEELYKDLAIPWKRGIIMHGPPGNGKTISIKALIKECDARGLNPLYVKTFTGWLGEEAAMSMVFEKARQNAPCVLILEDLDSLINNGNRSFFLNQIDGLEGNDGLLVIGTTNHLDQLDPGLSSRPSRFDRKFLFDDPDYDERILYGRFWQNKLSTNEEVDLPDKLLEDIATLTDGFSFAYLKEAFVSSLVLYVGLEGNKPSFESVIKDQIETLRKELNKFSALRAAGQRAKQSASKPPTPGATSSPVSLRDFIHRPVGSMSQADVKGLMDDLSATSRSPAEDYLRRSFVAHGPARARDLEAQKWEVACEKFKRDVEALQSFGPDGPHYVVAPVGSSNTEERTGNTVMPGGL